MNLNHQGCYRRAEAKVVYQQSHIEIREYPLRDIEHGRDEWAKVKRRVLSVHVT